MSSLSSLLNTEKLHPFMKYSFRCTSFKNKQNNLQQNQVNNAYSAFIFINRLISWGFQGGLTGLGG